MCQPVEPDNAGRHHLRVVILLFQSQGQSATVLAASLWQDCPRGTLFQYCYAAATFMHSRSVVIWKLNCSSERIISTLVTVYNCKRAGEHNSSTHHHHPPFLHFTYFCNLLTVLASLVTKLVSRWRHRWFRPTILVKCRTLVKTLNSLWVSVSTRVLAKVLAEYSSSKLLG